MLTITLQYDRKFPITLPGTLTSLYRTCSECSPAQWAVMVTTYWPLAVWSVCWHSAGLSPSGPSQNTVNSPANSHNKIVGLKPGFHYPSWRPELTARVDGWSVSITCQHGPRVHNSRWPLDRLFFCIFDPVFLTCWPITWWSRVGELSRWSIPVQWFGDCV